MEKKIAWQKYEEMLKEQINSPLLDELFGSLEDEEEDDLEFNQMAQIPIPMISNPVSETLLKEIALTSNFDCWIGHTNFNISPQVKDVLDSVDGIEILKVQSRYRFVIGIGRMFDFSSVRNNIESKLIRK